MKVIGFITLATIFGAVVVSADGPVVDRVGKLEKRIDSLNLQADKCLKIIENDSVNN